MFSDKNSMISTKTVSFGRIFTSMSAEIVNLSFDRSKITGLEVKTTSLALKIPIILDGCCFYT